MSILLYALLGLVLGLVGVSVVENPLGFIAVMTIVVAIDLVGRQ